MMTRNLGLRRCEIGRSGSGEDATHDQEITEVMQESNGVHDGELPNVTCEGPELPKGPDFTMRREPTGTRDHEIFGGIAQNSGFVRLGHGESDELIRFGFTNGVREAESAVFSTRRQRGDAWSPPFFPHFNEMLDNLAECLTTRGRA